MDLSAPAGRSVNDAIMIPDAICSLQYMSVYEAAGVIASLGQICLLAKRDIDCLPHCACAPRAQTTAGYEMQHVASEKKLSKLLKYTLATLLRATSCLAYNSLDVFAFLIVELHLSAGTHAHTYMQEEKVLQCMRCL